MNLVHENDDLYKNRSGEVGVSIDPEVPQRITVDVDGRHVINLNIDTVMWYSVKNLVNYLFGNFGYKGEGAKHFYKYYGVTASQVLKVVRKKYFQMYIQPIIRWRTLFFKSNSMLIKVAEASDKLDQLVKDGITNIAPFVAFHNETPQQLSKRYGKFLWKKICQNSFTMNHTIIKNFSDNDEMINVVVESEIPYSVLNDKTLPWTYRKNVTNDLTIKWFGNFLKINKEKGVSYRDTVLLLKKNDDVVSYCMIVNPDYLGAKHNWSLRRMKEEHDKYIRENRAREQEREQERRKLSLEYAEYQKKLKEKNLSEKYIQKLGWVTTEKNGVSIKILTTYDEVKDEGVEMGHCVGGYADNVMEEKYLVVSMKKGETRSTLGLYVSYDEYIENQHYMEKNKTVEDADLLYAAEFVVESLNSKRKD